MRLLFIVKEETEKMKATTRHKKTDFGDVWYISSVPQGVFRFAIYRYDDDLETVHLSNVLVGREHRSHGWGNFILATANRIAKEMNADTLCLKVKRNSSAHEWYGRHGYSNLSVDEKEPQFIWMSKRI